MRASKPSPYTHGPRSVMPTIPHQCHFERSEKSYPGNQDFSVAGLSRSFEDGSFEMTDLSAHVYGYDARKQTVAIHPRLQVRHAEHSPSMSFRAKREILAWGRRFLSRSL